MNDFDDCLERSRGLSGMDDMDAILAFFDGGAVVRESSREEERRGIDYVARLDGGAEVNFDAKRRFDCARYWRDGEPELTLEYWSVYPKNGDPGRIGWTLDEGKATHYILWTWPAAECSRRIVMPFQLLRVAFKRNLKAWRGIYRVNKSETRRGDLVWESRCIYIPESVVWAALREASMLTYAYTADTTTQHLAVDVAAKPGDPPPAPVQLVLWQ